MTQNITETDLCNQALGKLGANRIANLDADTSIEAVLCRDLYEEMRDVCLEEGRWSFAKVARASIEGGRVNAEWKFSYIFPLVADELTVLRVYRDKEWFKRDQARWELQSQGVAIDLESFYYEAIIRIEDPRAFSTAFRQALVYRLAAELAIPLTENTKLYTTYVQMYQLRIKAALALDGMQGRNEQINANRLTNARAGGGFSVLPGAGA